MSVQKGCDCQSTILLMTSWASLCCIFPLCKVGIIIVIFLQHPGRCELNTSTGPINCISGGQPVAQVWACLAADHSWAHSGTKPANAHILPPGWWTKNYRKPCWVTRCSDQLWSALKISDSQEISIISFLWACSSHLIEIFWLWYVQKCWWKAYKCKHWWMAELSGNINKIEISNFWGPSGERILRREKENRLLWNERKLKHVCVIWSKVFDLIKK